MLRLDALQANEVADHAAPGVGYEIDPRLARQRRDQLNRVVDGAFAHGAVLEGVNVFTECVAQHAPVGLGFVAQEGAEAAEGARCGTMNKYQDRFFDVEVVEGGRGRHRCILGALLGGNLPGVEARCGIEMFLDQPHGELARKPRRQLGNLSNTEVLHEVRRAIGSDLRMHPPVRPS